MCSCLLVGFLIIACTDNKFETKSGVQLSSHNYKSEWLDGFAHTVVCHHSLETEQRFRG